VPIKERVVHPAPWNKLETEAAHHLSRLLQKKHTAAYDPDRISARDAQGAIDQAEKIANLARRVSAEALPPTD
jgi:hypothetical protein